MQICTKSCASLSEKKEIMICTVSKLSILPVSCFSLSLLYIIFGCRDVFEWTRMTKGDEILGENERDKSYRHSDVF